MFHSVASWLEKKASNHWMKFIDARQQYKDTMAQTEIHLWFSWDGDDDNGEDVEWLNLSGKVWYLCNIAKDFGGRWSPATKQCSGSNFNFIGRASTFIGSHGGHVDGDSYKWQLHQSVTHHDE
eukprot:2623289-Rhodomonas_salina.1